MGIFSWLQYDFMKYAFLAILIITPLFGLMGTMIVNRKMAFFSDALGHSALTGIAIGAFTDLEDAASRMVEKTRTYEPRWEMHEKYMEIYKRYEKLYKAVHPLV